MTRLTTWREELCQAVTMRRLGCGEPVTHEFSAAPKRLRLVGE
jgi:hypothetical protein